MLNPVLPLPETLRCFLHEPKAWLHKWRIVHLAVGKEWASWAPSAADAAAALVTTSSASQNTNRVAVSGCVAQAVKGKLNGKEHVVAVKLAADAEVHRACWRVAIATSSVIVTPCFAACVRIRGQRNAAKGSAIVC